MLKEYINQIINERYSPLAFYEYKHDLKKFTNLIIQNHRRLWRWIMWQTILTHTMIYKTTYFEHYNNNLHLSHNCYLCEYVKNIYGSCEDNCSLNCNNCLLNLNCIKRNSIYRKWTRCRSFEWIKASYYAWRISIARKKKINNNL